jgi:hypothetical protein
MIYHRRTQVTRLELEELVKEHGDTIFVRAQVEGRWQSVPISQCDQAAKEHYIKLWFERGMTPIRLKDARENLP